MSAEDTIPVPSLSEETPRERPPMPQSRSVARRIAAQKGKPAPSFEEMVERVGPIPPGPMVAPTRGIRRYKVVESIDVVRGHVQFHLDAGQVLQDNHYNIAQLVKDGVKLDVLNE